MHYQLDLGEPLLARCHAEISLVQAIVVTRFLFVVRV